jgi:hypothetical protein
LTPIKVNGILGNDGDLLGLILLILIGICLHIETVATSLVTVIRQQNVQVSRIGLRNGQNALLPNDLRNNCAIRVLDIDDQVQNLVRRD